MLLKKVRKNILSHRLIEEGDKVIIGISGGADSICLALVLLELKKEMDFELYGVHLNHKIRGELARKDADFVREFCKRNQIPYFYFEREVPNIARREKLSEEEAGRQERYRCFDIVLAKIQGNKIAVAHHQNDQAETLLLHLTRGSGMQGTVGMRWKTNHIIRPFLSVSRDEIENYLRKDGQVYREDETNEELIYTRNKIRKEVIPKLQEINKRAVEHMANTCELMGEAMDFIDSTVEEEYKTQVKEEGGEYRISLEYLVGVPIFLQKQLIKKIIEVASKKKKDISLTHINAVLSLLHKEVGKKIVLPYSLEARREYKEIVLNKRGEGTEEKNEAEEQYPLREGRYQIQDGKIEVFAEKEIYLGEEILKKAYTKYFDCDKIKSNVIFRHRRTGDYLIVNAQGAKKSLRRFFIDEKVPREERDHILLLAEENHILWIVGWRVSEYYKITESTKEMLKVELSFC